MVLAISMDDAQTLAQFKAELRAPFAFIPDPEGRIATLFGVRKPGGKTADRKSFVIGEGRKVIGVESGLRAIDPDQAIGMCPAK